MNALQRRLWSVEDLADQLDMPDPEVRRIVIGESEIGADLADQLAAILGGSADFWLTREQRYREGLRALGLDEIFQRMPIDQMVTFGWIRSLGHEWRDRVAACSAFFDVIDAEDWNARYGTAVEQKTKYRASDAFKPDEAAVSAWLRQAEIQADALPVAGWDPAAVHAVVPALRALSRQPDPEQFIPELQRLLGSAGVAAVVVRAPKGCPISGAAFRTRSGRATVVLSVRHLADDHFWFSLFHELGHLLLHDVQEPVLDDLDSPSEDSSEQEANDFASRTLANGVVSALSTTRSTEPTMRAVVAAASQAGIAPGIVVGQLQHAGIIGHHQFNRLKRRYRWDGVTLRTSRKP
ncbi:ImmA/IrrE family metallo-endopeptidase [Nesterenkonia ebinurensis]|uniref:ImmA/IrrE family metallo-endopeptidase n=1 Tax=Nesterenkonia ebinurensis TaxID=2608252 RepID=UPI00168A8A60|nr:ImmA/IrrE family metallo-endopeptidase [Nesterenkonia ebinurensis]